MKIFGHIAVIAIFLVAIAAAGLKWAEMPFEVTGWHGECLFEAHPRRDGGYERRECGTTGPLGRAESIRFDHFENFE